MATKKQSAKKKATKKLSAADFANAALESLTMRIEELAQRAERMALQLGQSRIAYVTLEGRRIMHAEGLPIVKRFGWTQAIAMPYDDSRPVVRFDPMMGKVMIDCVRVYGAGMIEAVRVGRDDVTESEFRGAAVATIGRVVEVGSCITVQLGAVPR